MTCVFTELRTGELKSSRVGCLEKIFYTIARKLAAALFEKCSGELVGATETNKNRRSYFFHRFAEWASGASLRGRRFTNQKRNSDEITRGETTEEMREKDGERGHTGAATGREERDKVNSEARLAVLPSNLAASQ